MNEQFPLTTPLVVAVDIGTTKVCAIAGRKNEHGKLEILGVGKVESAGVMRGVVTNIEKTINAIYEAVAAAERMSGEKFSHVHVGIAGQHIKSLQHRGILTRDNDHTEISQKDIQKLVNDMYKLVLPPGDKILHAIPQEYTVDNEQGITDPIGMSGVRLEANFHIITGQISASNNIHRCVERTGLKVESMTLEPIASAISVLSSEEKEAGVVLVDIGGGTTDITIFQDGIIRHTAVIPFGGNVITNDIKEGCTVMQHQAEQLKVKFGSALAEEVRENRIITIPGIKGRDYKEISEKNLASVIQSRVEEILDCVVWEVRRSGYERKLIAGIVLTGGGAMLRDIEKLCELHTGMSTRIGVPVEHLAHGYQEKVASPIFSTVIGLLLNGIALEEEKSRHRVVKAVVVEEKKVEEVAAEKVAEPSPALALEDANHGKGGGWLTDIFKKTKEWFEAEPDLDLK
jgi:cell division protein FtsA